MAEENAKESVDLKDMAGKASELAKNIWLAGLGAYAKAADGAQEQYGVLTGKVKDVEQKAEKSTANFFEDLVTKGKKIEEVSQVKFTEVKEKASVSLEERLAQVKSNISSMPKLSPSAKAAQLDEISEKLDAILTSMSSEAATTKKKTAKKSAAKVAEEA